MPRSTKSLNGDDLLYRFLQDLIESDSAIASTVTSLILRSSTVWFPLKVYECLPVLLPWVVRDPTCRPKTVKGVKTPDEWGAPNSEGFFRDDNSLIKGIPKSLVIRGVAGSHLDGGKLGNGFVACHIWRNVNHADLASRHPRLNSFVPNLVWLPRQIAKLSDREGGHIQTALQRTSWGIYRSAPVRAELHDLVEETWALIPEPAGWSSTDLSDLHSFEYTDKFQQNRQTSLRQVKDFIDALLAGRPIPSASRLSGRYQAGLPTVDRQALSALSAELANFT